MSSSSYENWSREDLIARLKELEGSNPLAHPAENDPQTIPEISSPAPESFHFASYPRRKIALRFCYSGWEYNGLAYQLKPTPLPTVEGVIFEALSRARLIDPDAGYDGCIWEKCGRTDRGVSAGGQVISLWVRSALEENMDRRVSTSSAAESVVKVKPEVEEESSMLDDGFGSLSLNDDDEEHTLPPSKASRPELDYVAILNRLLPPTIRMLAWSPVSDTFSARFACKYRHYKYFFSSERLDITKMRDAASRLLGLHDFRNLCKLDPAKQITNFERRILRADIDPLDYSTAPSMYVLNLIGTAFLYHQVRHIMAVLLMVGRGLEHPSIVTSLLNVREGAEQSREGESLQVVGSKPEYQMADALPLMLWDCAYSDENVKWRTDGHEPGSDSPAEDGRGLYHLLHCIRSRSEISLALNQHFLDAASMFFPEPWATTKQGTVGIKAAGSVMEATAVCSFAEEKKLDPVEVANERWRNGKGFRRDQRKITGGGIDIDGDDE
ncbi:tRNA pseudouridine synthase [Gymnopus androsaceus JB14]|uniref:tRNA pseudouridine synthase n=1 Tax=Gymnopus androsaceus JB14 TaxID=1447944 RepID=A0A6A4HR24_9AGAR|nr:tRNA pseudouridine synthase [Gymnopus androsaceus JB14]